MNPIESIGEAKVAIAMAVNALPEPTHDFVSKAIAEPSPVVTIMDTIEAIYANPEKSDAERELLVALIEFAIPNAWHGINDGNRGARIVRAMKRDLGMEAPSGADWPEESEDPTPLKRFTEPAESPATLTPPPAP